VSDFRRGDITTSHEENEWSSVSRQSTLAGDCVCCDLARFASELVTLGATRDVSLDIDHDAIVASISGLEGMVVIPRQHFGGLEDLSTSDRARYLASLRRATNSLRERNPEAEVRITALGDLPSSKGHACFQVVAVSSGADKRSSTRGATAHPAGRKPTPGSPPAGSGTHARSPNLGAYRR
jgi:hypothetical protein